MADAIDGLILDYGQVLTYAQPAEAVADLVRHAGLPEASFLEAYWAHRRDYDTGLAARAYWARVLDTSGAGPGDTGTGTGNGSGIDREALIAALIETDARSWTHYRDSMWQVAAAFRATGGRTAILSNGVPEVMALVGAERDLPRWFDVVIVSYELGVTKPSLEIYEATLARLGTQADTTLFVDDRPENIEAARLIGLQTVHFQGEDSVSAVRGRLGLDDAAA